MLYEHKPKWTVSIEACIRIQLEAESQAGISVADASNRPHLIACLPEGKRLALYRAATAHSSLPWRDQQMLGERIMSFCASPAIAWVL